MTIALICHGGAGDIHPSREAACREGTAMAAEAGFEALEAGHSALDVVEQVVRMLEDNPQFNAGYGSALNVDGDVVTDAGIMTGHDAQVGAVGAVQGVVNPISLARAVMDDGRHALMVAEGAEAFARQKGLAFCDPRELVVPHERERWEEAHGTVGCLALDSEGRLAAASSTGGVLGKLRGRLGDTPLAACGFWADQDMAVTCTGQGEAMIRTALAHRVALAGANTPDRNQLAQQGIRHMGETTGGQGGLILLDRDGTMALAQNTRQMPVCGIGPQGQKNGGRIEQV